MLIKKIFQPQLRYLCALFGLVENNLEGKKTQIDRLILDVAP